MVGRVFGLLGCCLAWPAAAEVWTAECQGLRFRFVRDERRATVEMKTDRGLFPLAKGVILFDNGLALRAVFGPETDEDSVQLGLNRKRGIVYLVDRTIAARVRDGTFCEAAVRVEN